MTERTTVYVIVHSCPPHRVRTVLDILDSRCLTTEDEDTIGDTCALATGVEYSTVEIYCGNADLLADELIDRAPDVSFTVYEEPAYEGLGAIRRYVPELGCFSAPCDVDGTPLFTLPKVLQMRDQADEVWACETGQWWQTEIDAMPRGVVQEPDRFEALWDRRNHEITIAEGQRDGADLVLVAPLADDELVKLLAQHGYQLATEWSQPLTKLPVWHADLYRTHGDSEHTDVP